LLILFYLGHANIANGEWDIDIKAPGTKTISCNEILDLWLKFNKNTKTKLLIYLDSCFS